MTNSESSKLPPEQASEEILHPARSFDHRMAKLIVEHQHSTPITGTEVESLLTEIAFISEQEAGKLLHKLFEKA